MKVHILQSSDQRWREFPTWVTDLPALPDNDDDLSRGLDSLLKPFLIDQTVHPLQKHLAPPRSDDFFKSWHSSLPIIHKYSLTSYSGSCWPAWRLVALTRLGRDPSELPAETMLTDIKLTVLRDLALDDPRSPSPNDLGKALLLAIAMLGDFQNRSSSSDHPPGYETIWKGYVTLMHQSDALPATHPPRPGVRSRLRL